MNIVNSISIYCQNISGGKNKISFMCDKLTTTEFSVICLQETWFDGTVMDKEIVSFSNFNLYRQDRSETSHYKKIGGGLVTLISKEYDSSRITFPEIKTLQYICTMVNHKNSKLLIINIYVPYGTNLVSIPEYLMLLELISELQTTDIIICGDFNLPTIRWEYDDEIPGALLPEYTDTDLDEKFAASNAILGLYQVLPQPIDRNHLDLVFTTDINKTLTSLPIEEEKLDKRSRYHIPFLIHYLVEEEEEVYLTKNLGRINLKKSNKQLKREPFSKISDEDIFSEAWGDTYDATIKIDSNIKKLIKIQNDNTPTIKVKTVWTDRHPWLNDKKYQLTKVTKRKAHNLHMLHPNEVNMTNYKKACRENQSMYHELKDKYLKKALDETKGSTGEFFKVMRGNTNKDVPNTMKYNGKLVQGEKRFEKLAEFLGNSFLLDPPSFGNFNEEIDENLLEFYQIHYSSENENLWDNFALRTTLTEITRYINELKRNKDPGPMKLSAAYLQHNVTIVAPLLLEMVNTIFQTGRIPATWKQSYLIPIPKKGSTAEINNYRGIAIQSCVTKILDRILTRMIYDHIGPIIEKTQHGFMKGKGTTTNLAEIAQFLHDESNTHQIDIIYFDFSKAFDTVRHDLLALKLCKLSTPYNLFRIIMKFIMNRDYYLKVNNNPTKYKISPRSSVPQGSHLGPILFVIFTNNIGIDNILTYADDTKIFKIINNMDDRDLLQKNIELLNTWAKKHQLTLNISKTYHMSYGKPIIDSIYFIEGN